MSSSKTERLIWEVLKRLLISILIGFFFFLLLCFLDLKLLLGYFDQDSYFAVFSTVAQGFIGLVAFLGAVAVFQLVDQRTELSTLANFISSGNPWPVLHAHREVIQPSIGTMSQPDYINAMDRKVQELGLGTTGKVRGIFREMHENYVFEWEIRNRTMEFATISFVNVLLALILLSLMKVLLPSYGFVSVVSIIVLSAIVLKDGWWLVRRIIGYSKT